MNKARRRKQKARRAAVLGFVYRPKHGDTRVRRASITWREVRVGGLFDVEKYLAAVKIFARNGEYP